MKPNLASIIFSKNRALQLRAVLDSFFLNCRDSKDVDIVVLYKVTSKSHSQQYQVLKEIFKKIVFIEENRLLEQLIGATKKYEYVLLQVDDTIFTNSFLLSEVRSALQENSDALGFSLRLGSNTTYCYNHKSNQRVPEFLQITDTIVKYQWSGAQLDFGYPLEVSSSVYRTRDVMPIWLKNVNVNVPHVVNYIEDVMNRIRGKFANAFPYLLCYKQSVAFSNPMNGVSTLPKNWNIPVWGDERFSVDTLMKAFDLGYKMNVSKLVGFTTNSCHQEVELEFIK
ncbi:MAG: hypothetical protein QQN41_06895 [Nitrosopumilus sp.]